MSDETIQPKTNGKASLYTKMAAIMLDLQNVSKDGHNKFHKYDYASASGIANAIRPLMGKHNLAFFVDVANIEDCDGKYKIEYIYTFACGDTGETHECRWFGEAQNTNSKGGIDDKALAKAATTAQKYFLMRTFNISTEDDEDVDKTESGRDNSRNQSQSSSSKNYPPYQEGDTKIISIASLKCMASKNGQYIDVKNSWDLRASVWSRGLLVDADWLDRDTDLLNPGDEITYKADDSHPTGVMTYKKGHWLLTTVTNTPLDAAIPKKQEPTTEDAFADDADLVKSEGDLGWERDPNRPDDILL